MLGGLLMWIPIRNLFFEATHNWHIVFHELYRPDDVILTDLSLIFQLLWMIDISLIYIYTPPSHSYNSHPNFYHQYAFIFLLPPRWQVPLSLEALRCGFAARCSALIPQVLLLADEGRQCLIAYDQRQPVNSGMSMCSFVWRRKELWWNRCATKERTNVCRMQNQDKKNKGIDYGRLLGQRPKWMVFFQRRQCQRWKMMAMFFYSSSLVEACWHVEQVTIVFSDWPSRPPVRCRKFESQFMFDLQLHTAISS